MMAHVAPHMRHARLFQRGLHARKCRVERRAKIRYRYNNRNGNAGGNETVFDGGCSALVSQELLNVMRIMGTFVFPCRPAGILYRRTLRLL